MVPEVPLQVLGAHVVVDYGQKLHVVLVGAFPSLYYVRPEYFLEVDKILLHDIQGEVLGCGQSLVITFPLSNLYTGQLALPFLLLGLRWRHAKHAQGLAGGHPEVVSAAAPERSEELNGLKRLVGPENGLFEAVGNLGFSTVSALFLGGVVVHYLEQHVSVGPL